MRSIQEIQQELLTEFEVFDDWSDKYEYIIDLGKVLPPMNASLKTEETLVKGCQSKVWLWIEKKGDFLFLHADSDAIITKGLIGLLVQIYSGQSPQEIVNSDLFLLQKIGLSEHLSPSRANGLASMIQRIKAEALKHIS